MPFPRQGYSKIKSKVPIGYHAFDIVIQEDSKHKEASPFASSDSSHTSTSNTSNSMNESSTVKNLCNHSGTTTGRITRGTRRTHRLQRQIELDNEPSLLESSESSHHKSTSSDSLFHNSCSLFNISDLPKEQRKPLKDVNSQHQSKKPTKQPPRACKSSKIKQVQNSKENSCNTIENVPDFDDIEQEELFIERATSTPRAQDGCIRDRLNSPLGHHSESQPHLDLSHISNSNENSPKLSLEPLGDDSDFIVQRSMNVTFRRSRQDPSKKHKRKKEKRQRQANSSDSGNLSCDLADILQQDYVESSIISDHSELESNGCAGNLSLSLEMDNLSSCIESMHLRSHARAGANASPRSLNECDYSRSLFDGSSSSYHTEKHSSNFSNHTENSSELTDIFEIEGEEEEDGKEEQTEEEEGAESEEGDSEEEESSEDDTWEEQPSSSSSNKADVTRYALAQSFSEKLSFCKDDSSTAEEQVLRLCDQADAISFSECIPSRMMSRCVKIGEGVYGEVFRTQSHGGTVALKIIPIEGDIIVNDCPQKKFEEILPEVVIAKELSDLSLCKSNKTENFCQVNRISCVRGEFPPELLEQWDNYDKKKCSENDRPDMFPDDQLFIVFEFVDGGRALEHFEFSNHRQAFSVLRQVVFALAVAEKELEFEHRDLHIGNVLVRSCQEESVFFKLQEQDFEFPTEGVAATIIDFTISRLKKDGCAVFCDISTDEGLFEGEGDFQFDVYRDMRKENENDWKKFCPHSNVLWVNYVCKKLVSAIRYKENGRGYRDVQRHLRSLVDHLLDYPSCVHLTDDMSLWDL